MNSRLLSILHGILVLGTHFTVTLAEGDCDDVDLTDADAINTALDMTVICGNNSISVMVDGCILVGMGYSLQDDFSFIGPSKAAGFVAEQCAYAAVSVLSGRYIEITITGNFSACGTTFTVEGNHTLYKNAFRNIGFFNVFGDIIVRRKDIFLQFQCSYNYEIQSDALQIDPEVPIASGDEELASGDFEPLARMCYSSDCAKDTVIADGESVHVCKTIYLVIITMKDLKIIIIDVWATLTADPNAGIRYPLVTDRCVIDPTGVLDTDGWGISFFCFELFYWYIDPTADVYFHVTYTLCDENFGPCDPSCTPGRRRRAISDTSDNTLSSTIGPFKAKVE